MSRWIFPEEGPEQNEQKKKQAEIKKNEILESVYRSFQGCVRYGIGILGIGMDVVPNLPKCPVPVLMSYRTYQSVRYRY